MECQQPSIRYTEFSKKINKVAEENNLPISGAIEITNKCNMRCTHCYIPQENTCENELTTKELFEIVDTITEAGCLWLLITGGEPLMREDFLDIYDYIIHKGILVTLFTNGTLITDRIADHLAEKTPFSVEISLYGATAATYERITGISGSYLKCIKGIERLLQREIPLRLKTMGLKSNFTEVQEMKKLSAKLGVPFRFDPLINPATDGDMTPLNERLSPLEVIQLEKEDPERTIEWKRLYGEYYGYTKSDYVYTCGAGRNYFHIDSLGKLNMCVLLRIPGYDLKKGTFIEGYSKFREIRETKRTIPNRCIDCKINVMCGLCPGWSLLEKGDSQELVPYLCQVAHLRAKAFGVKKDE